MYVADHTIERMTSHLLLAALVDVLLSEEWSEKSFGCINTALIPVPAMASAHIFSYWLACSYCPSYRPYHGFG